MLGVALTKVPGSMIHHIDIRTKQEFTKIFQEKMLVGWVLVNFSFSSNIFLLKCFGERNITKRVYL